MGVAADAGPGQAVFLDEFRFDPRGGQLWRGDVEVGIRPKSAAALAALVARAGEVVSKQDLMEAVWPGGYITEGALAVCVAELRRAFGDLSPQPRFIATVHRRGYRLVVEPSDTPRQRPVRSSLFCGRSESLAKLWDWWTRARMGQRCTCFVAAQAGAGKTALLEHWVATGAGQGGWLAGFGQCVETARPGEPYQPVLEALGGLCRAPAGALILDVLRRTAPSWLSQLPGVLGPGEIDALRERVHRSSTSRMMRELANAVSEISAQRPLLLVFEDLHHADRPTVELISYLARRREPAQLMVVGTYRPEMIAGGHPLRAVVQDLGVHGLCHQLDLELLTRDEVGNYLGALLAPRSPASCLVDDVHERTEGNALFVVSLMRHLVDENLLACDGDTVRTSERLNRLGVPSAVRAMLQLLFEALGDEDRRLLQAAAVVGLEFSADALAAGLGDRPTAAEVEQRCDRLAAQGALVCGAGTLEWPDGTVTAAYRFTHEMYRDVVYGTLGPARRAQTHRGVAARLARAYGARSGEIAVDLAGHFERGGVPVAAAEQLATAARISLMRSAYLETAQLVRRGLELLDRVPDDRDGAPLELALRRSQVFATSAVWGWQDPAAHAGCLRLRDLATECGDAPAHAAALLGLHNEAMMRGDLPQRRAYAARAQQLADRTGDSTARLATDLMNMHLTSHTGDCVGMWEQAQQMLCRYRPGAHPEPAALIDDEPNIAAHELGAIALWQLGSPDRAREHAGAALGAARTVESSAGVAKTLWFAAIVHMLCGDAPTVRRLTDELEVICVSHDLPLWRVGGSVLGGWAQAALGDPDAGLARARAGIAGWEGFTRMGSTFHATVAGRMCLDAGKLSDGLVLVTAGLASAAGDGERQCQPELHRLCGELLMGRDRTTAERELVKAVDLATQRQARGWQLRAATSLARLRRDQGRRREAIGLLDDVLPTFVEGHDTPDVQAAEALLGELYGQTGGADPVPGRGTGDT